MTEIDGVRWSRTARVANKPQAQSGFVVQAEATPVPATGSAPALAPAAAASMLALQEVGGQTVQDRDARRHGHDLLDALAELQRALLQAGSDTMALQRLADLVASIPRATDPHLAAIVNAIVVRVRVELARHGA